MAKQKFYAVAKGRTPGVYETWEEAQEQVHKFEGATYKSFPSREEAEVWLKSNPKAYAKPTGSKRRSTIKSIQPPKPKPGQLVIFTDGGAIGNPGPGGYGAVLTCIGKRRELSGGYRLTTNQRMELMAVIVALETLGKPCEDVVIYSDSRYVISGIEKGWAKKWRANGWIKSDKKPAVSPDLWGRLLDQCERHKVRFVWVKGHSGIIENERCDALVRTEAKREDLPADEGYERLV